jgi:hypothetical protein
VSQNKFLLSGVILAILAGLAIAFLLATALPTTQVVKVKGTIYPGDALAGHLYLEQIPKRAVPEGAFTSIGDLDNKYSLATLFDGDVLRTCHVAETLTEGGTISARLRAMNMDNLVAFALDLKSTQGMIINVGDHLQICAVSQNYDAGKTDASTVTNTPVTAAVPTASGQEIQKPTVIVPSAPVIFVPPIDNKDDGVVVALTNEEFLVLSQAKEIGKLYVAVMPIGK